MTTMRAKVVLPSGVLLNEPVTKIVAEAPHGSFGLLVNHIDMVTTLVPGILALSAPDGSEIFIAVDEGVLVKRGHEVLISTRGAVVGRLGELRQMIQEEFHDRDVEEQQARAALERLEAGMMGELLRWEEV